MNIWTWFRRWRASAQRPATPPFYDRAGRAVYIGDEVIGDASDSRLQWGRVLRYDRTDTIDDGIFAGMPMAAHDPYVLIIEAPDGEVWLFADQIATMDSREEPS